MLDKMFKDESCSEKLYDAYRSVCFSRSKSIGPRIIAVVTAELVLAGRQAEWEENAIFWAAENLDDGEFRGFSDYLDRMVEASKATNPRRKDVIIGECERRLDIKITHERFDSQWKRDDAISVGPMNLDELMGSWAEKLRSRAIMEHDVLERNWEYRDDGERYIDGDGEVREISWWIRLGPTAFRLRDLIRSLDFN